MPEILKPAKALPARAKKTSSLNVLPAEIQFRSRSARQMRDVIGELTDGLTARTKSGVEITITLK
jgi:hypothetical protein